MRSRCGLRWRILRQLLSDIRGRAFTLQDSGAPLVAIINETMARRFLPNTDPLGKRFGLGKYWLTVVGIVGDVKFTSLTKDPEPEY